ncbi:MAG: toll/interleukin-1 receptor domain-containing protein [Rhodocyclaceae bacterium]
MSDICIIYSRKDSSIVRQLVSLLKGTDWTVWWDENISTGDWERSVRKAIGESRVLVAVVSPNTEGSDVFRDELLLAKKKGKSIFPFVINDADLPLGFGFFHRTDAFGWSGKNDTHFKSLAGKLSSELGNSSPTRPSSLVIRGKTIRLPACVFSLSSFETRLDPRAGIELLGLATPAAGLLSAYDTYAWREDRNFARSIEAFRASSSVLVLDSGNYEAFRLNDRFDSTAALEGWKKEKNLSGWKRDSFIETATTMSPDLAFSFDDPDPKGTASEIADTVIANTRMDEDGIDSRDFPICPIVHLPHGSKTPLPTLASQIICRVANGLDPIMIAVPERELGNGILERARTIREIRRSLNALGKYYPLHILGTGNPLSMLVLSAVGADSFDGLEWCRTVADWDEWRLHHLQHFDFFARGELGRLPVGLRKLAENKEAPYELRASCYNLAAFQHWVKEIQDRVGTTGLGELMELHVPGIGRRLLKELHGEFNE